jgi:AcrR family transcriptional regulator
LNIVTLYGVPPDVNTSRSYDASGRQRDAADRRRAVLAAARQLLSTTSYAATTIPAVARRAGVSPEFVYKAFRDKATLVREVLDVAIAGDDEPVAMRDRPEVARMRAEPDPREVLRLYADQSALVNARAAALLLVVTASSDPNLVDLGATVQRQRLVGVGRLVDDLDGKHALAVSPAHARDVIWAFSSPEVYMLLTTGRGWSARQYSRFLSDSWIGCLLPTEG